MGTARTVRGVREQTGPSICVARQARVPPTCPRGQPPHIKDAVYLAFRKGQMNKEEKLGTAGAGEGAKKGTLSVPTKIKVGGNFGSHHFIGPKSCEVKTLK